MDSIHMPMETNGNEWKRLVTNGNESCRIDGDGHSNRFKTVQNGSNRINAERVAVIGEFCVPNGAACGAIGRLAL